VQEAGVRFKGKRCAEKELDTKDTKDQNSDGTDAKKKMDSREVEEGNPTRGIFWTRWEVKEWGKTRPFGAVRG